MSALSWHIPQPPGGPIAVTAPGNVTPGLPPNELAGYRTPTSRENEVQKSLLQANLNVRAKGWMPLDM